MAAALGVVVLKRRFSARREVGVGLGGYALYLLIRAAVMRTGGRRRAARNARRLVEVERRLRLDLEPALQARLLRRRRLLGILNVAYVVLNVVLTVGVLARLFRSRHPAFHRHRRAAVAAQLGALPVFLLFPVAPPRAFDGFVDTLREVSGFDLDAPPVAWLYNPVAAMPSVHVAWALTTASAVAEAGSPRAAPLAQVYPPAIALIVLATGNHYVLDVVAGAALGAVAVRYA